MSRKRVCSGLVVVAVLGGLLLGSCGGGSGSIETATVRVSITDHDVGYDQVVLTIEELGIVASETPTTYYGRDAVERLPVTINVLDFPDERIFHLADIEVPMPASGRICFNQIRFVLTNNGSASCPDGLCNYVVEAGGLDQTRHELIVPSGEVKVLTPNQFCAETGQAAVSVVLDFDPSVAIVHHDKKPEEFKLKPTGIRIIEGAWEVEPVDLISGTVRIPSAVDTETGQCLLYEPVVTIEAVSTTASEPSVLTTVSLADSLTTNVDLCVAECGDNLDCQAACEAGPITDCEYTGPYKLLLPQTDTYDLRAIWNEFRGSADTIASGSTGIDLLLASEER